MNKKGIILFFMLLLVLFFSFNHNEFLKEKAFAFPYTIRTAILKLREEFLNKIQEHFAKAKELEELREELRVAKSLALLSVAYKNKLNRLLIENNLTQYNPSLTLIQTKSYVKLSDYNKVWIEFTNFNKNRIYGLIKDNFTAGIVISKNSKPIALLQGDSMCSFSVLVSKAEVPGIIFGNGDSMIVKFIPPWMNINIGDEVITSGLDNIFYEGIKVGKVTEISDKESYKTAIVKPYYLYTKVPSYYHIIDSNLANSNL